jgi:ribonucleoside-diphosphate reductase alpha chain
MIENRIGEEFTLSLGAERVVRQRYAIKDENGRPTENWSGITKRVVNHVATAETDPLKRREFIENLMDLMGKRVFLPNTPCLVNAGTQSGQLAACFVLPISDSIKDIMEHAKNCALIHKSGGGTGTSYEKLRPAGSLVQSTHGIASGPVSFMEIVNTTTNIVKQGGVRRGANMGILNIQHPDILRFIHAKNDQTSLTNFNISVTITDKFMEAVERKEFFQLEFDGEAWTSPIYDPVTGGDYSLYYWKEAVDGLSNNQIRSNPITFSDKQSFQDVDQSRLVKVQVPAGKVYAPDIWNRIVASAHRYGEPGVIFIDEVNRYNLLMKSLGSIIACNPCGEQNLHANNACNLGSIDVSKFFIQQSRPPVDWNPDSPEIDEWGLTIDRWEYSFDWHEYQRSIHWSYSFLDNVVDTCVWPLPEVDNMVKRTRPVGLGVMGVADLLLKLRIPYGSPMSLKVIGKLTRFLQSQAWKASNNRGQERGTFPEFEPNKDAYIEFFKDHLGFTEGSVPFTPRNYEVTTIAPTGTISLVAETSSGIEPNFSWAYVREDTLGKRTYVHPLAAHALGIDVDLKDEQSIERAARYVVEHEKELPDYFVTAMQINAEQHVKVLAAAQKYVDNSVSKTCNGAKDDTVESVDKLFRLAKELGCKAITYYRDGSRENQVLTVVKNESVIAKAEPSVSVVSSVPIDYQRPRELSGSTWKIQFEGSNLYVTVNLHNNEIKELFVEGAMSNAVGLLVSDMLQTGCRSPEHIARKLNKIIGTASVWFNERLITSPEQAVAECLLIASRRLAGLPDSGKGASHAIPSNATNSIENSVWVASSSQTGKQIRTCPECNGIQLEHASGCDICRDCGWSRCK